MKKIALYTTFVVYVCLLGVGLARAQEMSSGSYKIQSDSINFGGARSASGTYVVEDTFGEVASGDSSSLTYNLYAGYQQMQTSYLAVTAAAADVAMSPSIPGLTGGTSNGSTSITVLTDNPAGYQMNIKSSSSPALRSVNDSFADYTPAGADPDYSFSVAVSASEFGFSPEGADIVQRFKDNGSSCNVGSGDTASACWAALTTTDQTISQSTTGNHPNGVQTSIRFRAYSGPNHFQLEGAYYATSTITILPL